MARVEVDVRRLSMVILLLGAGGLKAATVTDVADAADGNDPLDAHISMATEYTWQRALITREHTQIAEGDLTETPRTVDVRELEYQRHQFRLKPRIEIGLFHDLSTFLEWPIVLYDQQNTAFASGTQSTNSTLVRDMSTPPRVEGWPQTEGSGSDKLSSDGQGYGYPATPYHAWHIDPNTGAFQRSRAGFDYPTWGIRWSPINNERDPTKPTVTLQGDYNLGFLPLPIWDPTRDAETPDEVGPVARGIHEFHVQVAMSKRWLLLDPYFIVDYWLPMRASDGYQGLQPRQRGGFTMGLEIVAMEDTRINRKLAIQTNTHIHYHSEGRDYSELSDALGEITYTGQFVRVGGNFGLSFRASEYVRFDLAGSATYDTEHFLTAESIGKDRDNSGDVDLDVDRGERNPYFNPIVDTPGRRLKAEENIRLQATAQLSLLF